jgi:penicillin G amidase
VVAGIVVGIVVVLLGAGWYVLYRRPLPVVSGTVTVPGLRAPVQVVRDRRGVPHVRATCMEDAAFAMGYVHAQDRGWQMEFNRRVASGRVSEFAGSEGVAPDRFMRRLGLLRVAEEEERRLDGEVRAGLDAYAAGVNAVWQSGRPLPLELQLLRIRPEPWRPAHSLALGKLLNLGLACNMDFELRRFELLRRLGADKAAKLDFLYADSNPTILSETARVAAEKGGDAADLFREASRWIPTGTVGAASNNWVVDGTMTETGRPMLCNDPHLPPSAPSIWYQAHVIAGDDFESTGVTLAGLPFPIIGHNRSIAWGYTNSFADVQDLVIEELADSSGHRYRTEDGMADAEVRREVIVVKGGGNVVEEVVVTRHGPLLERYEDKAAGVWRGLALQWTALTPGRAAESVVALQRADDWDSFRAAFASLDGPSQNVVYADVDGHIGYFLSGHIPVRKRPPSRLPVPGWDGDARWERCLTIDEVPQALDPAEHFVITANNRVVGDDFPHYIGNDYMNGYRALRLHELLAGRTGLNAAYMAKTQMDVVCPPAREVAELLKGVRCESDLAEDARQNLTRWDGVLDTESAEPCVYEAFMRRLTQYALQPLCGEHWRLAAGEMAHPVFGVSGNLIGGVTPHLLRRWRENDTDWFPDGTTWSEVARRALEDAVADLRRSVGGPRRWRWGRLHQLPVEHALGRRKPLNLLFNAGVVEVGGDTDTVLQAAYLPGEPYRTKAWAPSWRQIIDVGNWDECTGIHYPGQSGHPGSRHFRDLLADWAGNRQHRLAWSPVAVDAEAEATLVLTPGRVASALPDEAVVGKEAA